MGQSISNYLENIYFCPVLFYYGRKSLIWGARNATLDVTSGAFACQTHGHSIIVADFLGFSLI